MLKRLWMIFRANWNHYFLREKPKELTWVDKVPIVQKQDLPPFLIEYIPANVAATYVDEISMPDCNRPWIKEVRYRRVTTYERIDD